MGTGTGFEDLPNEIVMEVLTQLSSFERESVKRVCLLWRYLITSKVTVFTFAESEGFNAKHNLLCAMATHGNIEALTLYFKKWETNIMASCLCLFKESD